MIRIFTPVKDDKMFWYQTESMEYDTETNVGTSVGYDGSRMVIPNYPIEKCIAGVADGVLKEITDDEKNT